MSQIRQGKNTDLRDRLTMELVKTINKQNKYKYKTTFKVKNNKSNHCQSHWEQVQGSWGETIKGSHCERSIGDRGQSYADLLCPHPILSSPHLFSALHPMSPVFQQDYGSLLGTEIGCSSSLFTSQAGQMQGRWKETEREKANQGNRGVWI